jgi:hypothetical protein
MPQRTTGAGHPLPERRDHSDQQLADRLEAEQPPAFELGSDPRRVGRHADNPVPQPQPWASRAEQRPIRPIGLLEGAAIYAPTTKGSSSSGGIMSNPKNRPKPKATHPSDPSRPKSKGSEILDYSARGMGQRLRKLLDRLPK